MSTTNKIRCDVCGHEEGANGHEERGWGVLTILLRGSRDVCPSCVAKLLGWKGLEGEIEENRSARASLEAIR